MSCLREIPITNPSPTGCPRKDLAMPCASSCPDPQACAAFVALGYMVLHLREGEPYGILALPNAQTLRLTGGAWIATPGRSSGFEIGELRAVAVDRGGAVL